MKRKYFILISILILLTLLSTAAICNMCGVNITTNTTTAAATKSDSNETVVESTKETTAAETTEEITTESSQNIELIDNSKLIAVFAIANDPGDKLITFYSDADEAGLKEINEAIGEDGEFYTIDYVKKQESNDQDSFRVVADNFDNMEGYIYDVIGENLVPNNTYYLCKSEVINKENLLATVSSGIEDLDEETKLQIENIKARSVQEGWIIDRYSEGTQILIVVFEPEGDDMLMSIVLKKDSDLKFIDYPATFKNYSAWRVDDGGEIDPNLFSILFTAQTTEGLLITVSWIGAEGHSIFFLLEKNDSLERLPIDASRYTSVG